ncbi:chitosanase [Gynuella sp.]|uniref:chitosanase n=1 Tax=Gynuella sp. TaxID=2969146 RepID=UPI003D14A4B0
MNHFWRLAITLLGLYFVVVPVQAAQLTAQQRLLADQIISIFENNTPELQYGYAEVLDDGRGITAGRAGFTSATGDMFEVIQRYSRLRPDNALVPFLPRLQQLAESEDGSVEGLQGLSQRWADASQSPVFRQVQDDVVDELYFQPAMERASDLGAELPLTLLALYDAIIQHGEGDDADGLPAMIARTTAKLNGTPAEGVDERRWLKTFLKIRKQVLRHPANHETQDEWSESIGRVNTLMQLLKQGNTDLHTPLKVSTWGDAFILPAQ